MSRTLQGFYQVTIATLGALVMMSWSAHAEPSAKNPEGPFYIQRPKVNLRVEPDGDVLAQLNVNDKVFVIGIDGEWSQISIPAKKLKGWVSSQFLNCDRADITVDGDSLLAPPAQEAGDLGDTATPAPASGFVADSAVLDDAVIEASTATEIVVGNDCVNPNATDPDAELTATSFGLDKGFPKETAGKADSELASLPAAADGAAKGALPTKPFKAMEGLSTPSKTHPEINFKEGVKITSPSLLAKELGLDSSFQAVGGNPMGKITYKGAEIRESADKKGKSLGKAEKGDKVYFIGGQEPWYLVSVPGKKLKGWVLGKHVTQFPRVEILGSDVRMREGPGTDKAVITTLGMGEVLYEYERKSNKAKEEWVKLASSDEGVQGWVRSDFAKRTDKTPSRPFKVTGDQVNLRSTANVDGEIIAQLPQGTQVAVLGRNEKWAYAWFQGYKGWLFAEYLEPLDGIDDAPAPKGARDLGKIPGRPSWKENSGTKIGDRLIDGAREMLGTPYVWGGESEDGVDCSGLIYKLLTDEGAKCLPRRASEQMAQLGFAVEKEELQAGDLVFFSTYKPGPSHVGIYLGDGDFIHASSAKHQVAVGNLSERYYKERYCGARRITQEELTGLK